MLVELIVVLAIDLIAGTIGGIVGFGPSIMLMPVPELVFGPLVVGSSLTAGSFIARRFVLRLSPERFRLLMDGLMVASGLTLLWVAWRA